MKITPTVLQLFFACAMSHVLVSCQHPSKEQDLESTKSDLYFLSSDDMMGRETGTEGEKKASEFIAKRFADLGLLPKGDSASWFQSFSFKPHPPVQMHGDGDSTKMGMAIVKEINGRNVIGLLDNKKDDYIIIGAHYDHLGMGDENSLHSGEKAIHNGADDNASGVSALMLLIDDLKKEPLNFNVLFMAFSGEEKGLWGSNYFCDHPTIDLSKVKYMLNMDMVGRMKEDSSLAVYGVGTSPIWPETLKKTNSDSLRIITAESGIGPSDHTSFYLEDLPVLHFFTGQHEDYHKPGDDPEKINFDGILLVEDFIVRIVKETNGIEEIAFTTTKDEDQDSTPNFKVTLGVIPDYLFDGQGMRIDGVREERPAHNAGIIKGDIVISMGEHMVTDMKTYMSGLGVFSPGDTTAVTIIRDKSEMTLDVIWD
jgi:hypothetical protein